jgi:cytochrome c-type biogenesis protein
VDTFLLGVAAAASPCLLPLYPGFIAYLTANTGSIAGRRAAGLLGVLVLAGVLTTMLVVGIVLSILAIPFGRVLIALIPLVYLVLIVIGVLLVLGRSPFERLPGMRVPVVANPYRQAFLYGVMLGPIALPCAGPFLAALLGISLGVLDALVRVGSFVAFGFGFGLPLVLLSLVAAARGQTLVRLIVRHRRAIEVVAGVAVVAVSVRELVDQWPSIRVTLGA